MRIEYFQLIDRIVELNLSELTIRAEATRPDDQHHFRGAFSRPPADARRAADRIHGAGVRLAHHRAHPVSSACRSWPR